MHEHDLDLVASLADGSIAPDQEPEARALVERCGVCREELELQRRVREALAAAPLPRMTLEERSRMRARVLEQVGRPTPVVDLERRRLRRWAALGSAAAALLVLVGLGSFLGDLRGDPAVTMDAPVEESMAQEDGADTAGAGPVTTAAAFSLPGSEREAGLGPIRHLGEVDASRLSEEVARLVEEVGPQPASLPPADLDPEPLACRDEVDAVAGIVTATVDGRGLEVYLVPGERDVEPVPLSRGDCSRVPLPTRG